MLAHHWIHWFYLHMPCAFLKCFVVYSVHFKMQALLSLSQIKPCTCCYELTATTTITGSTPKGKQTFGGPHIYTLKDGAGPIITNIIAANATWWLFPCLVHQNFYIECLRCSTSIWRPTNLEMIFISYQFLFFIRSFGFSFSLFSFAVIVAHSFIRVFAHPHKSLLANARAMDERANVYKNKRMFQFKCILP